MKSDHITSFLLAALLHALGLLLIGNLPMRTVRPEETAPALEVSSVELTLASIEPESPSPASEGAAAPQPEASLPPLEMPRVDETPPPPRLPDKPAFTEALPQPLEPIIKPTPSPVPAPAPPPPPRIAQRPRTTPAPLASEKPVAPPPGETPEKAEIQPATGGSYGRVDAHPSLNRPIKPNYPIGSRRRAEEGTVILDITVAADGSAKSVSLVTSSGFPELDRAAERAALQARFKPGARNGRPVEAAARITIIFRLRDA
jgi:protein TonB